MNDDRTACSVTAWKKSSDSRFVSTFIAGYIRQVDLISGVKFAVVLPTIALITWISVG
jgi:flagellar protein FlaJ